MREILFRGKRADNGEWIQGFLALLGDDYYYISPDINAYTSIGGRGKGKYMLLGRYYQVLPETVGQDTGLTDKNGKKIFEGDCFETCSTGLPVYKHIVGYYPEHFAFMARCIEMNTVHYLSDYRPSAIEVIGNIHDNPELLEVSN